MQPEDMHPECPGCGALEHLCDCNDCQCIEPMVRRDATGDLYCDDCGKDVDTGY